MVVPLSLTLVVPEPNEAYSQHTQCEDDATNETWSIESEKRKNLLMRILPAHRWCGRTTGVQNDWCILPAHRRCGRITRVQNDWGILPVHRRCSCTTRVQNDLSSRWEHRIIYTYIHMWRLKHNPSLRLQRIQVKICPHECSNLSLKFCKFLVYTISCLIYEYLSNPICHLGTKPVVHDEYWE